jgi:flavorubredoxin
MKSHSIYRQKHQWIYFGRDPDKPQKIIDSNQFLIIHNNQGLLLDPGGVELFAPMLSSVVKFIPLEQITQLFASHQDPDIISSLGLWDQVIPDAKLHGPWLWESFIRHFGMNNIEYIPIPDEGKTLDLAGLSLQLIPAHYLHSSGNFNVYDPVAKILFSGDIGAALEPADSPLFVENFEEHIPKMKLFHQRWMPSNAAKQDWINRVRKLDIEMMLPQHGRMFKGENVGKFLDWFEQLQVGSAVSNR